MTSPWPFWVNATLFVVICAALAAPPLVNEFRPHHPLPCPLFPTDHPPTAEEMYAIGPDGNKDYTLWYQYGRVVVESDRFPGGLPLYIPHPTIGYPFMYPPFAAVCLAPLSLFGPQVATVLMVLLGVASFAGTVELAIRTLDPTGRVSPWVRLLPSAGCIFFIYDLFLLGQPNLGLLVLVLGGLMLARSGRGWTAGVLFAIAAALKAFPVVVLPYLLWRRQWAAAASTVFFLLALLFVVPVPLRGWERNLSDLRAWADGMLFSQGEQGVGQRPERSLGWRNQSLLGVGQRLLRAANARAEESVGEEAKLAQAVDSGTMTAAEAVAVRADLRWEGRPLLVNVVDLGSRGGLLGAVGFAGLLGLGFLAVMPRFADRTRRTDAMEFAVLVTLMTVASPYAYGYYFAWMIVPLTVLVHHALTAERTADRRIAWGTAGLTVALFAAYPWQVWGLGPAAVGVLFWSAVVSACGLGWLLVRERIAQGRG